MLSVHVPYFCLSVTWCTSFHFSDTFEAPLQLRRTDADNFTPGLQLTQTLLDSFKRNLASHSGIHSFRILV